MGTLRYGPLGHRHRHKTWGWYIKLVTVFGVSVMIVGAIAYCAGAEVGSAKRSDVIDCGTAPGHPTCRALFHPPFRDI